MLVLLLTFFMLHIGQTASEKVQLTGEPTFPDSLTLAWAILKRISVILPIWLLSLLGLARSFLGEDWFPFAQKIPVRVTRVILVAAGILFLCVSVAGKVYLENTQDSIWVQPMTEEKIQGWQTLFLEILFYGILLYAEQWCIQRNCNRQDTRKIQVWITVTLFLTCLIAVFVGGVGLWYIPLGYVDSPNRLEDYYLWWFSLYLAVFLLPFWFFSARKTVRLLRGDAQWLTLSTILPKRVTVWIALVLTGLMVWQIREGRYYGALTMDVPEYAEAAAMGHMFQAMLWGLALFYMLCLLVRQIRSAHKVKRTP